MWLLKWASRLVKTPQICWNFWCQSNCSTTVSDRIVCDFSDQMAVLALSAKLKCIWLAQHGVHTSGHMCRNFAATLCAAGGSGVLAKTNTCGARRGWVSVSVKLSRVELAAWCKIGLEIKLVKLYFFHRPLLEFFRSQSFRIVALQCLVTPHL